MSRLNGKTAIVTGGGGGIGRATAILFAKEGAKVVIADKATETGTETMDIIKDDGGEAIFIEVDISRSTDVKKMIKITVDIHRHLDVIVNSACTQTNKPLVRLTERDFNTYIDTNLLGVFLSMKYTIPEMIKGNGGSIVNICCVATDAFHHGTSVSATSREGFVSISKVAAIEHARHNIRVNVIRPGAIVTPTFLSYVKTQEARNTMIEAIPQGRLGKAIEVAKLALFLASDDSSYITGQYIQIDGGMQAWSDND
jgi:NAD(P)-dependent dehydrogenase (short-subunit alcohol dehydrogenase family)